MKFGAQYLQSLCKRILAYKLVSKTLGDAAAQHRAVVSPRGATPRGAATTTARTACPMIKCSWPNLTHDRLFWAIITRGPSWFMIKVFDQLWLAINCWRPIMTVVINCVGCRPWLHFLAGEQIHQKGESSANAFSKPCILKCGREAIVKPPLLFALHCIRFLDSPRTINSCLYF